MTGISLAPIAGFPLVTEIGERFDWRVSLLTLSGMSLVSVGFLAALVPRDGAVPAEPFRLNSAMQAYLRIFRDKVAVLLQISNMLRATAVFGAAAYLGSYLMTEKGVSMQVVGYVFLVGGIGYLIGSRLGDGSIIPLNLRTFYACSTIMCGAAFAAIFLMPIGLLGITALYAIANVGVGAGFVALNILLVEETPGGSATAMILRQSGFAFGAAGGGVLGGALLVIGGFPAIAVTTLSIAIVAALASSLAVSEGTRESLDAAVRGQSS